jgi:hypothetical protein
MPWEQFMKKARSISSSTQSTSVKNSSARANSFAFRSTAAEAIRFARPPHDAHHEGLVARPLLIFARCCSSSACLLSVGLHGLTQRRKNTLPDFIPVEIDPP